tara:strand:- start:170 stop:667 length:498 start_codon:yes stop_codon:yes gene_type:complete
MYFKYIIICAVFPVKLSMKIQLEKSIIFSVICLVWIGLVLGVSFLATPVKFMAPSLSLSVALDIGRQTFKVFNVLELMLVFCVLTLGFLLGRKRIHVYIALLALIIFLQTVWLLPVLDDRVEVIMGGGAVDESSLHSIYIVLEFMKLVLLFCMAFSGMKVSTVAK